MLQIKHAKASPLTSLSILTGFVGFQARNVFTSSFVPGCISSCLVPLTAIARDSAGRFPRRGVRACVQSSRDAFHWKQDVSVFENCLQQLRAVVRQEASYGVWVDVFSPSGQEARGLIHLSEMDEVSKIIQVGEEVKVYVSHVDIERGHLAVSPRRSSRSSSSGSMQDRTGFDDVYACQWLEAVVSTDTDAVTSEALFVDVRHPDLEVAQRGIVPISRIDLPRGTMQSAFIPGDKVHVRVVGSKDGGLLELSMKGGAADIRTDLEVQLARLQGSRLQTKPAEQERACLADGQDVSDFVDVTPDQWMEGQVLHAASYGIYVAVRPPGGGREQWGLVHLSELSENILVASQETTLRVRVKSVDVVAGRLFLSTKAIDSQESRAGWMHGSVDEVHKFGLIVRIPSGRGLVYVTEMDHYLEEPQTAFAVGQKVTVRILGEMEEGLLALSMKAPTPTDEASLHVSAEEATGPPDATDAQDLQIRALRRRLKDFLGISPDTQLHAKVQGDTPFGTMLSVSHPHGGSAAQALLLEPSSSIRTGDQLQVRIVAVDTHRGVLTVTSCS